MVVARKMKIGELTLVPFSAVLHDSVAPGVALSGEFAELEVVHRGRGQEERTIFRRCHTSRIQWFRLGTTETSICVPLLVH